MVTPEQVTAARADIQGFLLSAYGHLRAAAVMSLEIQDGGPARGWLRDLIPRLSTATLWQVGADGKRAKPPVKINVAFSYEAFAALGLAADTLSSFPSEFRLGMAQPDRSRVLGDTGDSAPDRWQLGGPSWPRRNLLILLKARDRKALDELVAELRRGIDASPGIEEIDGSLQSGFRLAAGKEHFGFRDAVSQPVVRGFTGAEGTAPGEFILGYENQFGAIPPTPVVRAEDDPGGLLPAYDNPFHPGQRDFGRNGCFVAYRKLQQDVAGFWRFLQREAERVKGGKDPSYMVWLAAKMVGRWPSGVPLVLAPHRDAPDIGPENRFDYATLDPEGIACPFGAHARRTNPRDMFRPLDRKHSQLMSETRRIIRRGTWYGDALFDLSVLDRLDDAEGLRAILDLGDDGVERGLHFFALNANIKRQFEAVQQSWCNDPHFNQLDDNKDPIIGDNGAPGTRPSHMTVPGVPVGARTAELPRFVQMRGGGYYFLPSLTALRYLSR